MDTGLQLIITEDQLSQILLGLGDLVDRHLTSAQEFTDLAAHLRDGGEMPLWASGESGAVAAEAMAAEFKRHSELAKMTRDELDEFVGCGGLKVLTYDDWYNS